MKKYYITFGTAHLQDFDLPSEIRRDKLAVVIKDETENKARSQIFDSSIGAKFCTSYDESDYDRLAKANFQFMDLNKLMSYKKI
jgi:hypothetical protein